MNERVQLSEILLDDPDRPERRSRPSPRASSRSPWRKNRSRRRSRSSPPTPNSAEQRLRGRARERQEAQPQDRLRPHLSAGHDRLHADRAGDPGRPIRIWWWSAPIRSDSVGIMRAVNETGFKPKMIGGAMVGLQATVFKTQLGPAAERHRQLRDLGADQALPAVRRLEAFLKEVSGARQGRRRRSARLLPRRPGAMPISRCWARRSQATKTLERRQDRRLSAQEHHPRPSWVRSSSARTANGPSRAHDAGPVQGHQGQRPRAVPRNGHAGGGRRRRSTRPAKPSCRSRRLRQAAATRLSKADRGAARHLVRRRFVVVSSM